MKALSLGNFIKTAIRPIALATAVTIATSQVGAQADAIIGGVIVDGQQIGGVRLPDGSHGPINYESTITSGEGGYHIEGILNGVPLEIYRDNGELPSFDHMPYGLPEALGRDINLFGDYGENLETDPVWMSYPEDFREQAISFAKEAGYIN